MVDLSKEWDLRDISNNDKMMLMLKREYGLDADYWNNQDEQWNEMIDGVRGK